MEKPKVTPEIASKIMEVAKNLDYGKKLEEAFPLSKIIMTNDIKDEKVKAIIGNDNVRQFMLGTVFRGLGFEIVENIPTPETKCNGSCEACNCKKSTNQDTKETSTAGQSE